MSSVPRIAARSAVSGSPAPARVGAPLKHRDRPQRLAYFADERPHRRRIGEVGREPGCPDPLGLQRLHAGRQPIGAARHGERGSVALGAEPLGYRVGNARSVTAYENCLWSLSTLLCAGHTGELKGMEKSNSEGVANCTGPRAVRRRPQGRGQKTSPVGVRAGWSIELRNTCPRRKPQVLRSADALGEGGRQHWTCRYREARTDPARSCVAARRAECRGTASRSTSNAGCHTPVSAIPTQASALPSPPKARAGCGNAACPDPWRGLWVTIISPLLGWRSSF